ncbi:MAG: hypothetical protein KAX51_12940 [Chromatiaceae bacterium]|nr:hypothetical protein [Chromatiaceae bacterium]
MGPPLASRVVFRQVQMSGADARIHAWLGIEISTATRHRTVQERGRAGAPREEALLRDIPQVALPPRDATGHWEEGNRRWRWVCVRAHPGRYQIGNRSAGGLDKRLLGVLHGGLMRAGYAAYRCCLDRLRAPDA